ncbi:hypothetical protein OJ253_3060 [Cryptosporidium canis]|uniref:Phosphorylated adapter RNA export protein n=1 Tax=Cryptosporidium canis TaxID=195482 RepID=A0A9D5HUU2_9CRYT|nr:hypothetical protein OJ253_3060 [Cryptosporidium canis]
MKRVGFLKKLKLLEKGDQERIKLLSKLVKELREPNIYLLERIVYYLPSDLIYRVFNETRIIIKSGGYPTEDSTRLKSPGGIFFRLVRNQIPHEEYKQIWNIQRRKKKLYNSNLSSLLNRVENAQQRDENMEFEDGELTEEAILTDDLKSMLL